MSFSDNLIQVNGFWVDLLTVESTLIIALSNYSLISIKLVAYTSSPRLALFYTSLKRTDDLAFLKAVRDVLRTCPSFPESLATLISFAQQLEEMPLSPDGEIDAFSLRSISEQRWEKRKSARKSRGYADISSTGSSDIGRTASMPPMTLSILPTTTDEPIPSIVVYSPTGKNAHKRLIAYPPPSRPSSVFHISNRSRIALEIASHVTTLLALPAASSVPPHFPLKLTGLNSITTAQLYFWLQERYEYDGDISQLFNDGISAESIANHIAGVQLDKDDTSARVSMLSTTESVSSQYSEDLTTFDDIDLETGLSKLPADAKPQFTTINPNPISYILLSWMTSLMLLGNKRPLTQDDLYHLPAKDESRAIDSWTNGFWREYETWSQNENSSKKPPRLWGSLMKACRTKVILSAFLWFQYICFAVFTPILIQQLIICAGAPPKPSDPKAAEAWEQVIKTDTGGIPLFTTNLYILAVSFFASKLVQTVCARTADQLTRKTSLNMKTALAGAIYHKSLRMGVQGVSKFDKSYILNLVTVDTEAIAKAFDFANYLWSIPLQLFMIVYLLSRVLGVAVWAAVGVLFISLLVLVLVVPLFIRSSAPMFMRYGDKRIKLIKEIMEGITLIKVRGWEAIFLQRLEVIRQTQLGYLKTFNMSITGFVVVGQLAMTLVPMASISLFGKEMGTITAARVFPAISFFVMLVEPLVALPQLLSAITVAVTSWKRIYKFLTSNEFSPLSDTHKATIAEEPIRIMDGSFRWVRKGDDDATEKSKPFMHGINVSIKKGSLTAIVGNVGSGKSSLLSAMLGEMECVSGHVSVNGSFAYCPQQAWIQSSTVQENILFGQPMDISRLKRAIGAASFAADLEKLPNGVASEIAERGANLSGGQKARLSLARAIYADSDTVLLDDPLAALDPRVGRTVFHECILGTLHGKTRVLVTQALHFLPQVDHVIVVDEGTVVEQGSYAQLYRANGHLRKLVDAMEKSSKGSSKKSAAAQQTKVVKKDIKRVENTPSSSITSAEDVITGSIRPETWWGYVKTAGGLTLLSAITLAMLVQQAGTVMMNQWLTWWTNDQFHYKIDSWFGIYDAIGVSVVILLIFVNAMILIGTLTASRVYHTRAFSGVLAAPMSWFHANPAGRVINRFSKDIESIDQRLMPQIFQAIAGTGNLITIVTIITRSAPVLAGLLFPLLVFGYFLLRFYRRSLLELKRLESRSISPLQSKVNETLDGIPTIAAFKREMNFADGAHDLIDNNNRSTFLRASAEVWVMFRMELIAAIVGLAVAMLGKESKVMSISAYGVALCYASLLSYILNLLVKSTAALESEMSSVERLQEYAESLPKDAPSHLASDPTEEAWPSRGEIIFKNVTAAYPSRPEKPVLRDVCVRIKPGTTTFIVGRTGSGKSTLLSVLLRLLEIGSGSVVVDGEDITSLGVHRLRRGMELIPQDPFIFSGTIRTALDFEGRYDDTALWRALELVGMKDFVSSQEHLLDTPVADNGSNYSVGQRQLFCLASAILRNPKILLLDEATASVDAGSDAFLQKTMRTNCPGATILSVMHRLSEQVLRECDNVLVMDDGVPAEFDTPSALLSNPNSLFSSIMAATDH